MRIRSLVLFALLPVWLAACTDPTVVSESVSARATAWGLRLHNGGTEPVYYFAVGRNLSALIDWIPCRNPDTCPRVDPGETEQVRWNVIPRHERGEDEVLGYLWRLVPAGEGGFEPEFAPSFAASVTASRNLRDSRPRTGNRERQRCCL